MTRAFQLKLPSSPPGARRVSSDDPDEVSAWVARLDGRHSRVVHGAGPYGFRLALAESHAVRIAWASTRLPNTVRGRFPVPTFHLPIEGFQRYIHGRHRFETAPGGLVYVARGTEVTRYGDAGELMAIDIDASEFESEVRSRRGTDGTDPPCAPRTLDLATQQRRELVGAIGALVRASASGAAAGTSRHGAGRVLAALVDALADASSGGPARVSARRVEDLEDWIDAHLSDVITLGRLCEVARIGERALQLAFQKRRGMSPLRFVCERRLAEAQRRLHAGRPEEDVTSIATSLGLVHLGRFATAYRAVFGESPSQTLMRGRAGRHIAAGR